MGEPLPFRRPRPHKEATLCAMLRDTADLLARLRYADKDQQYMAKIQADAIMELLTS